MTNNYQYDSCTSRGICSVNPKIASLQEIIVLYLKTIAFYGLKLERYNIHDKRIKNLIMNSISIMVSNPDFTENDFEIIKQSFKIELPRVIKEYEDLCKKINAIPEYLKLDLNYDSGSNITDAIKMGEKEFIKNNQKVSPKIRHLYSIVFLLAKSICINLIQFESFGKESDDSYHLLLELLDFLNCNEQNTEKIKSFIFKIAKHNNNLMKLLSETKTEFYGEQKEKDVSYTTVPNKAVLVVGSNIRELQYILEQLKESNIDVYTHDEMILAHTYPYFGKYEHLKGQYGQGLENCLLDFSTFPGPIILTKHSLYNVENLYRGRLFTTDIAFSKGIIQIKTKTLDEVKKSAKSSKGFKTGKVCETELVGFSYNTLFEKIKTKFNKNDYSNIFLLNNGGYSKKTKDYYEKLISHLPDNVLVISLECCDETENVISVNASYDSYAFVKITEELLTLRKVPITIFSPRCDKHTISSIIHFSANNRIQHFLDKCSPIYFNPAVIDTLCEIFNIMRFTKPKADINKILHN